MGIIKALPHGSGGTPRKRKKSFFPLEVPLYMGPITLMMGIFVFAPLMIILYSTVS